MLASIHLDDSTVAQPGVEDFDSQRVLLCLEREHGRHTMHQLGDLQDGEVCKAPMIGHEDHMLVSSDEVLDHRHAVHVQVQVLDRSSHRS